MEREKLVLQLNVFYNMQPDGELLELMKRVSLSHGVDPAEWMRPRITLYCRSGA